MPHDVLMEDIQKFKARNSPEGLFRRYIAARCQGVLSRLIFIATGSLVIGALIGPKLGFLAFAIATLCDLIDTGVLAYLGRQPPDVFMRKPVRLLTHATSALQAAGVSGYVLICWVYGGHEAHFFSLAFLMGSLLNSDLLDGFDRGAIYTKYGVYALAMVLLLGNEVFAQNTDSKSFWFNLFAAGNLALMLYLLRSFYHESQDSRVSFEERVLQQHLRAHQLLLDLRESKDQANMLAMVAKSVTDSIIISDQHEQITWVNPAFTKITGYSFDEVLGRKIGGILNGKDTSLEESNRIGDAITHGREIRAEILNYRKDGAAIWMETNIKPIFDEAGKFLMNIAVEREVTNAKKQAEKLETALQEAKSAAEAKASFLATMSHEIRTPMNGVIGMADLLNETDLTDAQQEFVDTIAASSDALLQIINDILDYSKLDAGKLDIDPQPFETRRAFSAIKNLMQPLAAKKNLTLDVRYKTGIPRYMVGDVGRVRQITLNLVGNAIKFTETGGVDVIVAHRYMGGKLHLDIAVSDTGIGIPNERVDQVFQQFAQAEQDTSRRFGGTGLGLTISRLLAQKMGGDVSVKSVMGFGSTFTARLVLDVYDTSAQIGTSITPQQGMAFLAGKTILIAEDNRTNRLLVGKLLASTKANLIFAKNGEDAVTAFATKHPDLILMDVSMPRKDGKQATLDIRAMEDAKTLDRTPIIALTANAFQEDKDACFAVGMDGFLTKPIRKPALHQELGRVWLDQKSETVS